MNTDYKSGDTHAHIIKNSREEKRNDKGAFFGALRDGEPL